jgi:hypothetical protein
MHKNNQCRNDNDKFDDVNKSALRTYWEKGHCTNKGRRGPKALPARPSQDLPRGQEKVKGGAAKRKGQPL